MPKMRFMQLSLCWIACVVSLLASGCHNADANLGRNKTPQPTPNAKISLSPDHVTLRDNEIRLGDQDYVGGKIHSAVLHFRRASALDPTNTSLKIQLATALNKQGKTTEAISVLQEAELTATNADLKRTAHNYAVYLKNKNSR